MLESEPKITKCSECDGSGKIHEVAAVRPRYAKLENAPVTKECPYCNGKGRIPVKPPLA